MQNAREAILKNEFEKFKKEFYLKYDSGEY
jgi:queuine/archaeosine tRNA-ribosyltransferase